MRIAVDAMGGDHAPASIVAGAVRAGRDLGVGITLVGASSAVSRELGRHGTDGLDVHITDAPDVVDMAEQPGLAMRRKRRPSVRVAVELVARGEAQACFTAGHTGAAVLAAHGVLGMLSGVDRPALAALLPTRRGSAVLLDVGANADCRPAHLVQFAVMGSVFARVALGIAEPRVALLSIGEEAGKGNELTRDAYRLLEAGPVRFVGNVEARDLYRGDVDVIVSDGFTGNVALKVSEGLVDTLERLLIEEAARSWRARLGFALSRPSLRRLRRRIDDAEYGGVPLLGVAGVCIIGHGHSSARAVRNGIALAERFVRDGLLARVAHELAGPGGATSAAGSLPH